jgi:hypothetical protein
MGVVQTPPASNADKRAEKWAATRARGRHRYVWLAGVVGFGLCGAVIKTIIEHIIASPPGPFLGRLGISLAVSPIFGYWFASMMWSIGERNHERWLCRRDDRSHSSRTLPR